MADKKHKSMTKFFKEYEKSVLVKSAQVPKQKEYVDKIKLN